MAGVIKKTFVTMRIGFKSRLATHQLFGSEEVIFSVLLGS